MSSTLQSKYWVQSLLVGSLDPAWICLDAPLGVNAITQVSEVGSTAGCRHLGAVHGSSVVVVCIRLAYLAATPHT